MAYNISDFDGTVVGPGGSYPYGDVKNAPSGTRVNKKMVTDLLQTAQRIMAKTGITPNGTPDNSSNGFQVAQALGRLINRELGGLGESFGGGTGIYVPVRCSGLAPSILSTTLTVTAGWFFHDGKFVYFGGGSCSTTGQALLTIAEDDGIWTATLSASVSPVTPDATHSDFGDMVDNPLITLDSRLSTVESAFTAHTTSPAWTNVSAFGTGWAAGTYQPRYSKDAHGRVQLQGSIYNPVSTSPSQTLFTLPSGYRPSQIINCLVLALDGSIPTNASSPITVSAAGDVKFTNPAAVPSTANWQVYLDIISFPII